MYVLNTSCLFFLSTINEIPRTGIESLFILRIRHILFNWNCIYLVLSCISPIIWANIWICDSWFPLTQSPRAGGDSRDEWVSSGHHLFSTRVAGSGRRNVAGWDRYSRAVSWPPDRGHSAGPLSVPRFHIQSCSRVPFHRRVPTFLLVF